VPPAGRRLRTPTREKKPETNPLSSMPPPAAPEPKETETKGPELLRTGLAAEAKVISVVDERTIGPVTRSRLALQIHPGEGDPFEVTVRVAFPTPEARAKVKVGGKLPVRYDKEDHTRVVVDIPQV
jgi:hypothetical protein